MEEHTSKSGVQIVYFSHGGGPLPILGDPGHTAMVAFMKQLPSRLRRPEAVLVISAHWEESVATLLGAVQPPLFYDYYGFPEEAYTITYPAPGHPELAARIARLLGDHDIEAGIDPERGFDHGHFIPLMLMYPEADIPCLQLSLMRGLDPETHIALGHALADLEYDDLLVIGSGFSFHNMHAFSWRGSSLPDEANDSFQNWLIETCTGPLSQEQREKRMVQWEQAPSARYCHPREEHLLPLHVCLGMSGMKAELIFDDYILGKRAVALKW